MSPKSDRSLVPVAGSFQQALHNPGGHLAPPLGIGTVELDRQIDQGSHLCGQRRLNQIVSQLFCIHQMAASRKRTRIT
jgi:hypothetical protein